MRRCIFSSLKGPVALALQALRHSAINPSPTSKEKQASHPQAPSTEASSSDKKNQSECNNNNNVLPQSQRLTPGPYRKVGNMFVVRCVDHPFKFSWEINKLLRSLRLEYKGQTTVIPDVPATRRVLFLCRHVVNVDILSLDEAKKIIGVPDHITFQDLDTALTQGTFGRGGAMFSPVMRSKVAFTNYRKMRMRDILHRDAIELKLLRERKKLKASLAPGKGENGKDKEADV